MRSAGKITGDKMLRIYLPFFFMIVFLPFCLFADGQTEKLNQENDKRISEIEERLDGVEKKTLVDRVDLSADIRMTLNNYIYRERSNTETRYKFGLLRDDGETFGAWNMRGRLKLVSRLGDYFKFTGWLTMYKQFIESAPGRYNSEVIPTYDMSRGTYPGNSQIYFERLYVDWFITQWLALTIGRVPSTDGPPSGLRYNTTDMSSFPENLFNSPADGIYFTFDFNRIAGLKNNYLRIWYVPRFFLDETIQNTLFVGIGDGSPNLHYMGIAYDMEIPKLPGSIFSINMTFSPDLSLSQYYIDYNGDGIAEKLKRPGTMSNAVYFNYLLFLEIPRLLQSSLDFFASFGGIVVTPVARTSDDPNKGFVGTPVDPENGGLSQPGATIFGSDLSGKPLLGFNGYFGLRYNLPIEIFNDNIKVGADYNFGTKYFFQYYAPDTTGLNRFSVRGHHAEAYVIVPVYRKASLRLGYIFEHHDYPQLLMNYVGQGIPQIDETIHNFHAMLNVYF